MEKGFYAFGTMNYVRIDTPIQNSLQEKILDTIEKDCYKLDDKFSVFKESSEISQINSNAGIKPVVISNMTLRLLKRAKYFAKISKGAFDITVKPAMSLWAFGKAEQKVPSEEECKKIAALVNYKKLVLDEKESTAYLKKAGQSLDLGGIAKGYAGDYVREIMISGGVKSGVINLGGTIFTIGSKINGAEWKVGIQDPKGERGKIVGTVSLNDGALVTSGINERFFISNNKRYHHILDPKTCRPVQTKICSVTAAGGSGCDLDGIATALFVMGTKKGVKLADSLNIDVLYLLENGSIIATKGFAEGKYKFEMKGVV